MRVAQVAPPWFTVPPRSYGGIELVVSLLTERLVARGHDVTLFASGGSETKATLVSPLDDAPDPALLGSVWFEARHALLTQRSLEGYDVVHDHSGVLATALAAVTDGPPMVHTLHGPWTGPSARYYELVQDDVDLVAISDAQRRDFGTLRIAATVHNGIDVDEYPFRAAKEDLLVYIGRANPDKGPARAIEIARRAGVPLAMIIKKSEAFERAYWDEIVAPMLFDGVEVYEGVDHETKVDLLGRARAFLFPIDWAEPFGLVMIEAMACGTPVVTCPVGAAVEVVEDGVTGALRESLDDLVEAVDTVRACSPEACRARVVEGFSADAMLDGYEAVYERATGRA